MSGARGVGDHAKHQCNPAYMMTCLEHDVFARTTNVALNMARSEFVVLGGVLWCVMEVRRGFGERRADTGARGCYTCRITCPSRATTVND